MDPQEMKEEVMKRFLEATEHFKAGKYQAALDAHRAVKRECNPTGTLGLLVETAIGGCLDHLRNFSEALHQRERVVMLSRVLNGPQSLEFVSDLSALGDTHVHLKQYGEALKAYMEAKDIMEGNGLASSAEEYGVLLRSIGALEMEQKRYEEAMEWFRKAEPVLCNFNENGLYAVLVNDMAGCFRYMGDYGAAVARYELAVAMTMKKYGPVHPEYATTLENLGYAFFLMKRFDEAILRFEEALTIYSRIFGGNHPETNLCMKRLQEARDGLNNPSSVNEKISDHRICGRCHKIATNLQKCSNCERIHYCSAQCQQADWDDHALQCAKWTRFSGCASCGATGGEVKRCSSCHRVKYCSVDCQRRHWAAHKTDCRKWKAEHKE